jgi:hypothetical protein
MCRLSVAGHRRESDRQLTDPSETNVARIRAALLLKWHWMIVFSSGFGRSIVLARSPHPENRAAARFRAAWSSARTTGPPQLHRVPLDRPTTHMTATSLPRTSNTGAATASTPGMSALFARERRRWRGVPIR